MTVTAFRRSVLVAVLLTSALGAGLLTAPSAAAGPLGSTWVYKSSPTDVLNYKGVTVFCPAGKR